MHNSLSWNGIGTDLASDICLAPLESCFVKRMTLGEGMNCALLMDQFVDLIILELTAFNL